MPWSHFRHDKSTNGASRRHSVIDGSDISIQDIPNATSSRQQQNNWTGVTRPSKPPRNSSEPPRGIVGDPPGFATVPNAALREQPQATQHFSMLKHRYASDPQISKTAKTQSATLIPAIPAAPSIVTTAPAEYTGNDVRQAKASVVKERRPVSQCPRPTPFSQFAAGTSPDSKFKAVEKTLAVDRQKIQMAADDSGSMKGLVAPPPYGDETDSSLALPITRLSESSRSDGSLGDHGLYATTTTTHTVSTTTTFFRLPHRKKKDKGPLFPLPVKPAPLITQTSQSNVIPRTPVASSRPSSSPRRRSAAQELPTDTMRKLLQNAVNNHDLQSPLPSPTCEPKESLETESIAFARSGRSSPNKQTTGRGRSSTKGSSTFQKDDDNALTASLPQSGRTSTSTAGRVSMGGVFNRSRVRQEESSQARFRKDHPPLPGTPLSAGSKSHSLNLSREATSVPVREEGETPARYLMRLEGSASRNCIATILSLKNDDFYKNVLRSYMRGFKFFGEPLDMAVRKLLMEVELPKETQQIDRVLQSFANRYHECNPGVYASPDEAYFIAFSILILHTDVFNKNNKNKMQKQDYTKNARDQGVADEILECFYDNIAYTPFIHLDGEQDLSNEKMAARKLKKTMFARPSTDSLGRPSREPVDPYTIILDDRMESLRPPLKEVMNLDDHYNYLGTAPTLNLVELSRSFFKYGIIQILSSRSRPEAFTSPATMANPAEAHPGVVDMKVTKVGILWRKDMKKKKARSPWQEWGAILTGASLYFFRNPSWVKSLMHQHDFHHKHDTVGLPCMFRPPLESFKPDVLMPTQDAVALVDTSYKKHKNAIVFVRHGGMEETFIADNELEMNDWLAKLNFAAAFRTAGVQMREVRPRTSTAYAVQATQTIGADASLHTRSMTPSNEATSDLAYRVQMARRQIVAQKISEAEMRLTEASRQLEVQLRNARHLQILAPIQNKTREQIVLAAGGMAAKIKWMRMDIWRIACHRDILAKDLQEELDLLEVLPDANSRKQSVLAAVAPPRHISESKEGQEELLTPPRNLRRPKLPGRPVTQPLPEKPLDLNESSSDHSRLPETTVCGQTSRTLWELPPLSFQTNTDYLHLIASNGQVQTNRRSLTSEISSSSLAENMKLSESIINADKVGASGRGTDDEELHLSRDVDIQGHGKRVMGKVKRPETPDGDPNHNHDIGKSPESDFPDGKSKVRRSLHRTLRESAHVPSHNRIRKAKDLAGSNGQSDDPQVQSDKEGLARGTGSFTVHGKKASVITFGSEWQGMSPDERLKLRRQAQSEGSKMSVPSAIDVETDHLGSPVDARERPNSAVSTSTTTLESVAIEEAVNEKTMTEQKFATTGLVNQQR